MILTRVLFTSVLTCFLVGCGFGTSNRASSPPPAPVRTTPVTAVPVDVHSTSNAQVHAAHSGAVAAGHHVDAGVSPSDALAVLIEGNDRFVHGSLVHPAQDAARRAALTAGQKPSAIILSCSDSRVPPEVVFDRGLGDLFVVRTAGEVADATALASIEYAVEHLGARLIVVMGHSSCGAVKAALSTPIGSSAGSSNLDILVGHIRPHISKFSAQVITEDPTVREPVRSNVEGIAKSLSLHSAVLRKAIADRSIKIVQAIYNLDSGKVDFWF